MLLGRTNVETQDYAKYSGFTVNLSGGFHMYKCVNIVT